MDMYKACSVAAHNGNLKLLKWLIQKKKFEWNNLLRFAALNSGNKYVVKWVFEKKCNII